MPEFYVNPYGGYSGFYFKSLDDFLAQIKNARFEEYDIEFIDGTQAEMDLFNLTVPKGESLEDYFDLLDRPDHELAPIAYLLDKYDLDEILEDNAFENVILREGTPYGVAYDLVNEPTKIDRFTGKKTFLFPQIDSNFDLDGFGVAERTGGVLSPEAPSRNDYHDDEDYEDDYDDYREEVDRINEMTDEEYGQEVLDLRHGGSAENLDDETKKMYYDYQSYADEETRHGGWDVFSFEGTDYVVLNRNDGLG